MPDLIGYLDHLIGLLESDYTSHRIVLLSPACPGKMGFGSVATASSIFDIVGYLITGSEYIDKRFAAAISSCYFNIGSTTKKQLYLIIRCGVQHQLFPKNLGIGMDEDKGILYDKDGHKWVNGIVLLRVAIDGLKKFTEDIRNGTRLDIGVLSTNLDTRYTADMTAYNKAFPLSLFIKLLSCFAILRQLLCMVKSTLRAVAIRSNARSINLLLQTPIKKDYNHQGQKV